MFISRRRRQALTPAQILDAQVRAFFAAGEQGVIADLTDLSTLFQDAGGTVPVTAPGQPIGKVLDKSGRGNHETWNNATYQVDGNGKPYIACNGTTTFGTTAAINFSATDKMSLWAGVHKAADTGAGIVIELTVSATTTNGGFNAVIPAGASDTIGFTTRGTVAAAAKNNTGYAAPLTLVVSCAYDNAGSGTGASAQVRPRVNGAAVSGVGISGSSAGNYANAALNLAARNAGGGTRLPAGSRVYSHIVRGAASSALQFTQGEAWVNARTGAF